METNTIMLQFPEVIDGYGEELIQYPLEDYDGDVEDMFHGMVIA